MDTPLSRIPLTCLIPLLSAMLPDMIYNTYGQTGIDVSAIGFGGMRFPSAASEETCAELVKTAYDAGINYFDTAPGYGRSEDLFGLAFRDMLPTRERRPFYVSTKTNKADPDKIRKDVETSLQRMGLESVDFLHMWCIMSLDSFHERRKRGALKELEKLQNEGLARHIVVSTHMPGSDIGEMLRAYPFEGVLLGYSASNFAYREAGIEAAAELGRGVVCMNPLGGGTIPRHPERFEFVRTRPDATLVQGALRFLLDDPRITIALVGFDTQEHLQEALGAVAPHEPLADAERKRIRESLKDSFNELCTGCAYCDQCPEGIPIPKYMEAYNHWMLSGDPRQMISRLRYHWGVNLEDDELARCTECGQCEDACTQHLPIPARLKQIRDEIEKAAAQS